MVARVVARTLAANRCAILPEEIDTQSVICGAIGIEEIRNLLKSSTAYVRGLEEFLNAVRESC